MKTQWAALFVLAFSVTAAAGVPAGQSAAQVDQRIGEIDAALSQILSDALNNRVPDAQKADVSALQQSLEAEKNLLVARKELLKRLDGSTVASAAPALPASPAESMPSAAAPAGAAKGPLTLMPVSRVKPNIPDDLCRHRASGWVDLDFAVLNDGKVADVKVTNSQPKGAFDAAAAQAVAGRTYPPQAAPVKLHERLPMSFADCRSEQLRAAAPQQADAAAAEVSQADCPSLAEQAKTAGDLIDSAESGRAVLSDIRDGAQVYSAPSTHCFVSGRKLKPGNRLTARIEYNGFSLVAASRGEEAWVPSNQLKDTSP